MKKLFLILPPFIVACLIMFSAMNLEGSGNTILDTLQKWEPFAVSKELSNYSTHEREIIRKVWFKKNIESLPEFQMLSEQEQKETFNRFIEKSLAIEAFSAAPSDIKAIQKAAELGFAEAQFDLGYAYTEGEGVPQDHKKAEEWVRKAAEQGLPEAQYSLGYVYYNGKILPKDHKKAASWFRKASEQGYAPAQCHLGIAYYRGHGVDKDYNLAFNYWKMASEQGNAEAQGWMGVAYSEGRGVPKNIHKAIEWWEKAANTGDSRSQFYLGQSYIEGEGVPQNYISAYAWLSLAASQGEIFAKSIRDSVAEILSRDQIIQAQEIADRIQRKINDQNVTTKRIIPADEPQLKTCGTGFLVTTNGFILTCNHVVKEAATVRVKIKENIYIANIIKTDAVNDLALIKISGSFKALPISPDSTAKMGQEVFTIGYPNPELQGTNPKLTKGEINSLSGFQDDIRLYQISVAVQPGNSGGPLIDEVGNVTGIIVAILDAKETYKISSSLPQNVNYAIKASYAKAFLSSMPEVFEILPTPGKKGDFEKVVERVSDSVVMVLSF
ncbi:MAG: tetratricopeptide repeat-containing serine protease family protein [Desulfobacteraceae bacterium]|nr:tetratricopeptide repeat-containing serine protease family protein [Desulfobacteraceae bacterium]